MSKQNWRHRSLEACALMLPTLFIYTLVIIYPICNMMYTSFFEWNGIPTSPYVFTGWSNYLKFFSDVTARTAVRNVFIIMGVSVLGVIPVSFYLATVISKKFFGLRAVKAVYFLPVVINKVAIGLMITFMLYPKVGPAVRFMQFIGIQGNLNLLGNMKTAIWVCAFTVLWCNTGFHMILFSSAMTQIPTEIYEAVEIDGASSFQKLRFVTIPMLRGAICMSATLLLTNAFKVFDLVASLTNGGPGSSSQVLTTLIFKNAFYFGDYGYANAIGVITVILCLASTLVANKVMDLGGLREKKEGAV